MLACKIAVRIETSAPVLELKVHKLFIEISFVESEADKCVLVGMLNECVVYLAIFVDDGLLACKSAQVLNIILDALRNGFEITVGDASYFIGLEINRDRSKRTMLINQCKYIRKILDKYGMNDVKPKCVPADPHVTLLPADEGDTKECNVPYRESVGSLTFLAMVSRPDIAFAVNALSRFLANHDLNHWRAVKRVFAYLSKTTQLGLMYRRSENECDLVGFCDADFASVIETRRSTSGYVFCMAGGPVTWSSQRQRLVTLSTTESEYAAAATAAKEAIWIRKLLSDIEYRCETGTLLYVDNQSAIKLAKNPEFHKRTKHIDIRYHYLREKYQSGEINIQYVPSEVQKADILTKPLARDRFTSLRDSLGLVSDVDF